MLILLCLIALLTIHKHAAVGGVAIEFRGCPLDNPFTLIYEKIKTNLCVFQ
jgi:hypothetical protein